MWQRNNGNGEINLLQNKFSRYLFKAIKLDKAKYLDRQTKLGTREVPTELERIRTLSATETHMLESVVLEQALEDLSKRDRYIFLARVIDKQSYDELATELVLSYKGVTAAYYRVLQKLKQAPCTMWTSRRS